MSSGVTLSLDSGTPQLSLALETEGGSFSRTLLVGRAHAERLPAELEAIFAEAGLPLHASTIVIGTGPGSYTGLRVGASYALGLGRAWGAPVLGVCTLEALAGNGDGIRAVSLDARKEHVYGAVYRVQGGVVVETLHPAAKYPLSEFTALAAGLTWHRDLPPDARALARNAAHHGAQNWELAYL